MLNKWLIKYKRSLIIGFVLGAFVFPALSTYGLVSSFFENLRFLLIGPFDLIAGFIPDVQISPGTYSIPVYKWFLTLGFNGLCYAFLGALIQFLRKK